MLVLVLVVLLLLLAALDVAPVAPADASRLHSEQRGDGATVRGFLELSSARALLRARAPASNHTALFLASSSGAADVVAALLEAAKATDKATEVEDTVVEHEIVEPGADHSRGTFIIAHVRNGT